MKREHNFCVGEYYHLYNRGVEKRTLFKNPYDHNRFMTLLYLCNSYEPVDIGAYLENGGSLRDLFSRKRKNTLVDIAAYCLMPNHFHILVREGSEKGISIFMQKLGTAYATYFNKKYKRTGTLFEGPFKAKHVDTEPYLLYLTAYIHLNPVKLIEPEWKELGIRNKKSSEKYLHEYAYSSFLEYAGGIRPESSVLTNPLLDFARIRRFSDLVEEWSSKTPLFTNAIPGKASPSPLCPGKASPSLL